MLPEILYSQLLGNHYQNRIKEVSDIDNSEKMTFRKAIEILREHNTTGKPVLRITSNRWYEQQLLTILLDGCEQLLKENAECKDLLRYAIQDFNTIGEIDSMPTPMLHKDYAVKIIDIQSHQWRYIDKALLLTEGDIDYGNTSLYL